MNLPSAAVADGNTLTLRYPGRRRPDRLTFDPEDLREVGRALRVLDGLGFPVAWFNRYDIGDEPEMCSEAARLLNAAAAALSAPVSA